MDLNKCLNQASKLADKAVDRSSVTIDGEVYTFTFSPSEWVYKVTDEEGNFIVNFNTKKITQAKKWLKDHLSQ